MRQTGVMRWVWVVMFAVLGGCRAFEEHREQLASLHARGRFPEAAAMLDSKDVRGLYEPESSTLWLMERGAAAIAIGGQQQGIELLEQAEKRVDDQREQSAGDVVAAWVLSDAFTTYIPGPSDDMYLNVMKMLAQLERGNIVGGASVEARRMARKADLLRDRYLEFSKALGARGGAALRDTRVAGRPELTNPDGRFVESPLGVYLSAVTFMHSGDPEFQRVAGRRLDEAIKLQRGLIGGVSEAAFAGIGERSPLDANVLIVALSGRAPTLRAEKIGPIPLYSLPVYMELPQLRVWPSEVSAATAEWTGGNAALDLVEDLSIVAAENHRRILPQIYARTFIRYAVKAGATVATGEVVAQSSTKDKGDRDLIRWAAGALGTAFLYASERADLRSWSMLPGQARVGLVKLAPGPQTVRVSMQGAGGTVFTQELSVNVPERGLATVVVRYWR